MPEFKDTMPQAFKLKGMMFKDGQQPMMSIKSSPLHEESETETETETTDTDTKSSSAGHQIAKAGASAAGSAIGSALGDAIFGGDKQRVRKKSSAEGFQTIDFGA